MGMEVTDICMDKERDGIIYPDGVSHYSNDETTKQYNRKHDSKMSRVCLTSATKSVPGNVKMKCTVPQPFALATDKRALCATRPTQTETDAVTPGRKLYRANNLHTLVSLRQNEQVSPSVTRKPLQTNNKKHPHEEDPCLVASLPVASPRNIKPMVTLPSAPSFRSTTRAERRKEFYTKLEEKHHALEAEKTQWEARSKEERDAAVKQLRKNLMFKANPMPRFYHDGPPPKVEVRKPPPTRAKSPKLGRRKSCSDAAGVDKRIDDCGQGTRHSLGIYKGRASVTNINANDQINSRMAMLLAKAKTKKGG